MTKYNITKNYNPNAHKHAMPNNAHKLNYNHRILNDIDLTLWSHSRCRAPGCEVWTTLPVRAWRAKSIQCTLSGKVGQGTHVSTTQVGNKYWG